MLDMRHLIIANPVPILFITEGLNTYVQTIKLIAAYC